METINEPIDLLYSSFLNDKVVVKLKQGRELRGKLVGIDNH